MFCIDGISLLVVPLKGEETRQSFAKCDQKKNIDGKAQALRWKNYYRRHVLALTGISSVTNEKACSMKRRVLITAAVAAALSTGVSVIEAAPMAVIESYEVHGLSASVDRIHEAIKQAAQLRKWGIKSDEPGRVLLVYPTNNRSLHYQATIGVTYANGSYKVEYVSSRGLNEKKQGCYGQEGVVCAHRNVNRWIANLGKDLRRLLMD